MDPSTDTDAHLIIGRQQTIDGDIELDSLSDRSVNANPSSRKRRLQLISSRRKASASYANADPHAVIREYSASTSQHSSQNQNLTADHNDDDDEADGGGGTEEDDHHAETEDAAEDDSEGEASESDVDEDDELHSDDENEVEVDGAVDGDDAHDAENDGEDGEVIDSDNDDEAAEESEDAASEEGDNDDDENNNNHNESTSYYSDSESESSRTDSTQSGDDDDAEDSDENASQKKSEHPDDENSVSDDQEEFEDYKVKKCYYPVQMEDFYAKRYSVIRKIGWGHFSTVWLCYDVQTKRFVALKVVRAGKTYCETAEDEIKLGLAVDEGMKRKGAVNPETELLRNNLIRVLDNFNLSGPFGKHVCITFDLLGQNLLDLIKRAQEVREEHGTARYGAIPLANVRSITEKILRGLKHLHENCQIIHTDLKPENVLVAVSERSIKEMVRYVSSLSKEQRPNYMMSSYEFRQYHKTGDAKTSDVVVDDRTHRHFLLDPDPSCTIVENVQVKIADLGNACWTHKKFTDEIQTKEYRALESIVVADYGTSADIWSVACIAYECATGDYLFPCRHRRNRTSDEDHLLMIIERCGRAIPKKLALAGKESKKFFNSSGKLICCPDVSELLNNQKSKTIRDMLTSRYSWTNEQARAFAQFLLPMLEYDPDRRATADAMLQHSWMSPAKTYIHLENHVLDADVPLPLTSPNLNMEQHTAPLSSYYSGAIQPNVSGEQQSLGAGFSSTFQFQPLSASSMLASTLLSMPSYNNNDNMILQQQVDSTSFVGKINTMPYDGSGGSGSSGNTFSMDNYRFSSAALSSSLNGGGGGGNEDGNTSFKYGRFDAALGTSNDKRSSPQMMMSAASAQQHLLTHNDLMRDGGDFLTDTIAPLSGGKLSSSANSAALGAVSTMDEPVRKIDSLKLRSQS